MVHHPTAIHVEDFAKALDELMHGSGFGDGRIAQGDNTGCFVTRVPAVTSPACKAAQLNLCTGVFRSRKRKTAIRPPCVRRPEAALRI